MLDVLVQSRREAEPATWERRFYEALQDFRFLPGGRILSGTGSGRRVTLFNCFVMGRIEGDLGGIFAHPCAKVARCWSSEYAAVALPCCGRGRRH